jgi:hypothetical protein
MNVNLLLLKTEIEKEIRSIATREEALRSQLINLQSVVGFLRDNERISEKCRVGEDGSRPDVDGSNGDSRASERGSGIKVCPSCDVKVLPTKEGRCPSCQMEFQA